MHGIDVSGRCVVVGCSGGPDSAVLLHVIQRLGAIPVVAHVNYGLRGEQSDADERLVSSLAERYGVLIDIERLAADAWVQSGRTGLQERAREIRYRFLADSASRHDSAFVAVGHTLDDQSETAMLHLIRGTGIDGVGGMPVVRQLAPGSNSSPVALLRPLLTTTRHQVECAAMHLGLEWNHDQSNDDPAYFRGRLRTIVRPAVVSAFGEEAWLNVGRTSNTVGTYSRPAHRDEVNAKMTAAAGASEQSLRIDKLCAENPVWRSRLLLEGLKRWCPGIPRSRKTVQAVEALLDAQVGRRVSHPQGVIHKERGELHFASSVESASASVAERELRPGSAMRFGGYVVHCHELAKLPDRVAEPDCNIAFVDDSCITDSLVIRNWRPGDRILPIGGEGSKLISDVLTDGKLATRARATQPVVTHGSEIVWCPRFALDRRYAATDKSSRVLMLVCTTGITFGRDKDR